MSKDICRADGTPFFTNVTDINAEVAVGLLADSPAVLVKSETGGKFIRLTAPEAKMLAEKIKELAA